jgi:hypothetical protein
MLYPLELGTLICSHPSLSFKPSTLFQVSNYIILAMFINFLIVQCSLQT